ncbi:MAG: SDR family oxidoreductase [Burkholderiales bacterium]|nr:SDR family oxidoreductase [Burkholderiales bacterium]
MNEETRAALVTGGAQGIGKGITEALLRGGWRVLIADVDSDAGAETATEYAVLGDIRFANCDVSNETEAASCVMQVLKSFGRLDGLVNNAGISASPRVAPQQLDLERWNRVLAINLTGAFLMAKHCAPHLEKTNGAIVNIASTRALQSEPNTEAYSVSKGGIVALTHALAISLGPQVRVNCISPGWIDTGKWQKSTKRRTAVQDPAEHAQHPVGRIGTPLDIGELAVFLLSAAAGFITGQNIASDGGMTRKMIYQ